MNISSVSFSSIHVCRVELRWQIRGKDISFIVDVATTGWLALGWSLSGSMVLSEAVIGNLEPSDLSNNNDVDFFKINGYSLGGIRHSRAVALSNVSVVTMDGRTTVR